VPRLPDKTVIVTGASRGIGRSTALSLANEGAQVALLSRDQAALEEVASEVTRAGGRALVFPVDFADSSSVPALASSLLAQLESVHALVNNAGTFLEQDLAEMTDDELRHVLDVNLMAPFVLTRELLPALRKTRGQIINVVSTSALQGYPQQSGYCASKAGLLGMMRALALEEKPNGVRIHNLCPGGVDTAFIEGTRLGERLAGQVMISPDDIGEMIVFLLRQPANVDLSEMVIRRFT
jgi:3-oxoacyl-[acyl-carrier protein] reductase